MIARISRKQIGIVDYLLSGKRADSNYTRDQKDNTICLYGNMDTLDKSIKYLYENKNYKDNYLHISISFSKNDIEKLNNMDEVQREAVLKDITETYIKHHTSGYDLQNEVIAYAEAHKPKIKINEKGNERLEHIHIVISKQNALSNTQLKTTFANTYIDNTLQTYINKKYNFDEPKNHKRTKETEKTTLRDYYKNALSAIKKEEDLINYFETRKIKYKKVKTKRNEYYKIFLTDVKNKEVAINLRGKDFKNLEFIARNHQEYTVHNELDELEDTLKAFYAKRKIEITKRRSKLDNDKLKKLSYPTLSIENNRVKKYNNLFYIKGYKTEKSDKNMTYTNYKQNIQITDDTEKNELHVNYSTCDNKQEAVKTMLDIAIAKGWKLENLEVFGSDEFKKEAYKQIKERLERQNKKQKLELKPIERAVTPVQQNIKNMQDTEDNNKTYSKEYLAEIKEKINLNEVLKYAQEHYKIDIKNYELTKDNKINNVTNKQKPKNVIDFFNKEVNLTIQESIKIAKEIYDEQQIKTNIDIKELKKELKKELSKDFNKELPKYDIINNDFNIKGDKMYLSVCKNQNKDNTKNWEQVAVKSYKDLLNVVTNYHYSTANFKDNYRSSKNVESFNPLLIYDIDNDKDSPQLTMQEAQNLLKKHNISALIVSTKSHKKEKNNHIAERFRILIPLQNPIQSTDKETYREIQKLISNDLGLTNYVDPMALNDTARSYYKTPVSVDLEYKITSSKNFLDITKYEEQAKINIEQEKQNHINKMENIKNKAIQETNKQISDYENYAYSSNFINIVDYRAIVRNVDITKIITQFETLEKQPYSDSANYLYYETKDAKYNIIDLNEGGNLACDFKNENESNKTYNVVTYLEKHLKTNNLTIINNYLNANGFGNYSKINTHLIGRICAKHEKDIYKIDDLAYHICNECIIKNPQKVTITKQDNRIHFKIFENEVTLNENFAKKLEDTIKANNERLNKERAKKEAEEKAKKEAEEKAKKEAEELAKQQQVVRHTNTTKKKSKEWD